MYKNLFTRGLLSMMFCAIAIFATQSLDAQCTNTSFYNTYTNNEDGAVQTLASNQWTTEYSIINGIVDGSSYVVTLEAGGVAKYITLYQSDGTTLIAHGPSPLSFTGGTDPSIQAHWTEDAACATASSSHTNTLQCTTCVPPPVPACSSNEMAVSQDPTCGLAAWTLSWDASADATAYSVSVGSAAGLTDIIALTNVGAVLTIDLTVDILTDYYWTVVPTNSTGPATGCSEQMFTTGGQGDCYCTSAFTNTSDDWISNVVIGDISNASGSVGYEDYTAVSTDLEVGGTYTIDVSVGMPTGYNQYVSVYVDWDQNNIFDEAVVELGFCNAGGGCMVTGSIDVPAGAALGATTMRIIERYNAVAGDPCVNSTYGETEDYTVNVVAAAVSCGTPMNISHDLFAPAKVTIDWDAVPGALRYDVHYRVSGGGPTDWTRSGALNATKTLHYLAPNTVYDYIVRATCDGTWDFATASPIRRFNTGGIPPAEVRENMFAQGDLNVFPNPARESINVSYTATGTSDVNISIVDMMGKVVFNKQLTNVEGQQNEAINVSNLGQGYYMLVLQSGEDKMVKKFATIR